MAHAVIVVGDDERGIRLALDQALKMDGYEVHLAETAKETLRCIEENVPDLVLLDLRLPDGDGLEVLQKAREIDPSLQVIMLTGHGTVDVAVRAMRAGAVNFIEKPFQLEHLKASVEKALEHRALRKEIFLLRREQDQLPETPIVGSSKAIRECYRVLKQVAQSPTSTVLITGESGTGKELFARAAHHLSPRKEKPFVDVNCAALTESLLEAELFGYEKGAFTGASTQGKIGLFDAANGGTIFLDEIGEMDLSLQVKLLRVLQERRFKRVGGVTDIKVDVRIVASTNRELRQQVEAGKFREDLFYRLNVVPIHLPPLRERREDIPELVKFFLEKFSTMLGKYITQVATEAEEVLIAYDWPGNIRELQNVIERATILCDGETILRAHLNIQAEPAGRLPGDGKPPTGDYLAIADRSIAAMEKQLIRKVLDESLWRRSKAARILGINRTTLYNKIKEYGIEPPEGQSIPGSLEDE
jgi:DNA-binding NtrC family response regulator